jgi:tRNA(Ile)-lysidine synthase
VATTGLIRRLAERVDADALFEHRARIVVGVSGGPDSMALLHALCRLNEQPGYDLRLRVAHLNHQLRDADADADETFVRQAADRLGLPCSVERVDVRRIADAESGSLEESARRCRYAFLERVANDHHPSSYVAVGHHADDQAETVLHRVVRGTGWRGLAGIPPSRPIRRGSAITLVRPLLSFTRDELLAFLSGLGATYRVDKTNQSLDTTRNRLRHAVLPMLQSEFNPQVCDALLRLAEQAQWVDDYLRETVQRTFDSLLLSQTDQALVLNAAGLAKKPRIVQAEVIRRAIRALGAGERHLAFVHLRSVIHLLTDRSGTQHLHLPDGVLVTRSYDRLTVARPTDEPHEELAEQVAVHVPGVTILPQRHLEIRCQIRPADSGETIQWRRAHPRGEEWLDYDALHLPLIVRSRRPGDRFWPLGAPGTRKVSECLTDAKLDPSAREQVALLCDQLGPVYAIGYRIDDRVKLTASTRNVLHVQTKPLSLSGADRHP